MNRVLGLHHWLTILLSNKSQTAPLDEFRSGELHRFLRKGGPFKEHAGDFVAKGAHTPAFNAAHLR